MNMEHETWCRQRRSSSAGAERGGWSSAAGSKCNSAEGGGSSALVQLLSSRFDQPRSAWPTSLLPPADFPSSPGRLPLTPFQPPFPPLPALSAPSCLRLSSLTYLQHASCFMVTWSRAFHAHAHTHILACLLKHNITEHTHTSAHTRTHTHIQWST